MKTSRILHRPVDVRMILWNANDILTHVIGMRQLVIAATKRKDPNQSKARSFVQIDSSSLGLSNPQDVFVRRNLSEDP